MKSSTLQIIVPPEAAGQRADIFFANLPEISTRSAAQKILTLNAINKNRRLKEGEGFMLNIPAPAPLEAVAEDIPLQIIYEDADLLVIDKPRGLVVHPAAGHAAGTLVNALLFHCKLSGIGGVLRPGIVHRLDKDTSGLMVVAKNDAAHVALAEQLERREMHREYNALCVGAVKKDRLRIDLAIGRHPRDRKKMAVSCTRSRPAVTRIEVLERFKNHTLIAAYLETGRTHQIRVHMAHIGHPVLGDVTYGASRQRYEQAGQILHSVKIKFEHPTNGKELEFTSPLPEYFKEALQYAGGKV
ncbi:MAG: RluA family pseudouridine synthase [Defluviitaleaceae bacterium]|nr:RluA family pseudouridine synthase [Defluviitaleaceae bacterium]